MRVYFLVEGRRTESKVYAAWLSHLVPELSRIAFVDDPHPLSYFLISAEGYPSIISEMLPASIRDINLSGTYNYLVVSLDADEESVEDRVNEINQFLEDNNLSLLEAALVVIIQNRCIESWFLGNRRIVTRNPLSASLRLYQEFYDIVSEDPELMGKYQGFGTHAQFHLQYLREIFRERSITYSKRRPGHVLDKSYLDRLIERVADRPSDLPSLQIFFTFCERIREEIGLGH
ncbi:MAG: hypothetical protein ACREA9_18400 [Pyrinomonadaceae bacterium]